MVKLTWMKKIRLKKWESSRQRLGKMFMDSSSAMMMSSSVSSVSGSDDDGGHKRSEIEPIEEYIPDPHPILALGHLYCPSRILLVAVEMELFTILAEHGEMTHEEIRDALGLHPRATPDFPDALVCLKMLQTRRDQSGKTQYSNTPETALFLDKARPQTYVGQALEECSTKHYMALDDHGNMLKDKSREVQSVMDVIKACNADAAKKLAKARKDHSEEFLPDEKDLKADAIFELAFGFWKSRVLLTAVEWRLFSHIEASKKGCLTAEQVGQLYGIRLEVATTLLETLTGLQMLVKRCIKDKDTTYYANTIEGALFLDYLKPTYLGARMEWCSEDLYRYWGRLPEALKTGKQQTDLPHQGAEDRYNVLYEDDERTSTFCYTQAYGTGHGVYTSAVRILDFSKYKTLVDIGGSSGQFACYIAQKNPHMQCITADLPQVHPIAERMIPDWGGENQVTAISLDCFKEPFPKVDCVVWGMMLTDYNMERQQLLIRKAFEALPEKGGALYALEFFMDDERCENFFALCGSLQALLDFGADGGFSPTLAEYKSWCLEAGFSRVEFVEILGPIAAGIAYKD